MGQAEIVQALKDKKWWLSREITEKVDVSLGSVQASLRRMIEHGEVEVGDARKVIRDKERLKSRHFVWAVATYLCSEIPLVHTDMRVEQHYRCG